jgi:phage terminase small subunit
VTEKQKLFANEYLIDLNATRAYKAVYKSVKNDETARTNSSRLLTNANVKNYIAERMKEREKRTEITQDMVLKELATIAFTNGTDFAKVVEKSIMQPVFDADGNKINETEVFYKAVELELTDNLTEDKKKAIACIKQTKFGIEVNACDKVKALELLGKHLGMFTDKVELSGSINNEVEIIIGAENIED